MRSPWRFLITLAPALALAPAHAAAQGMPGDPEAGRRLAESECAVCHRVAERQATPLMTEAPSFAAIANTPGVSPMALNVLLQSPHPTMPNLILEAAEAEDVIAYVWSLRGQEWAER